MNFAKSVALVAATSCTSAYPVAELEDPNTCKQCHPKHFEQWSGSMHAYASDDPVFVAMNKRGQREAQLGAFCVQCHAPMAVIKNPNQDFANFDPTTLPASERGITCYFCHNVASVKADHNNGLVLARDQTMRGGIKNPVDTPAHQSLYDDTLMAGSSKNNRSELCGSCHDIVTPAGVHLERTFAEWKTTIFGSTDPAAALSCARCHMDPSKDVIADAPGLNVVARDFGFHNHSFPAIDQAMTPFPGIDAQTSGIAAILNPSLAIVSPRPAGGGKPPGGICLVPPDNISVRIDTFNTGHNFPSGASHDRRTWLEVIAYAADGSVVFSSGAVPQAMDPEDLHDATIDCVDSNPASFRCSGFWDRTRKADGSPAQFFWDVASTTSFLLKPPVTLNPNDPAFDHSTTVVYSVGAAWPQIDRITARVVTQPLPHSLLRELVASGDLDPTFSAPLPRLQGTGATKTWNKATAGTGASVNTKCNYEPL